MCIPYGISFLLSHFFFFCIAVLYFQKYFRLPSTIFWCENYFFSYHPFMELIFFLFLDTLFVALFAFIFFCLFLFPLTFPVYIFIHIFALISFLFPPSDVIEQSPPPPARQVPQEGQFFLPALPIKCKHTYTPESLVIQTIEGEVCLE